MEKVVLNPGTLLVPVPAVMVSCGDMEQSNIITIAWTGIINSKPPLTYVSIRKERHSHNIIQNSGEFVINMVTRNMVRACDFCGVRSGRDIDKFGEMRLTKLPGQKVTAPLIGESPVSLECKVTQVQELGSHDMFMAEIVSVHADKDLMDKQGKLLLDTCGLVAYAHGEYFALGEKLGSFGYSVRKPGRKKTKRFVPKD